MDSDMLGVGWALPLQFSPGGALTLSGDEERVRQAIWLILTTAPGERVMRPDFGCGIHDLVFAPGGAETAARVAIAVRTALSRWEPRIDMLNVSAAPDDADPSLLLIMIDYRLRATNTRYNLVYPFYLE
jgi:uncharacterized protein